MALAARFPGTPIDFGGEMGVLIVPGLSLAQHDDPAIEQAFGEGLKKAADLKERLALMTTVVKAALARNYPPFAEDVLRTHLDLNTIRVAFTAVMGNSGMAPTREVPSGNGPAATAG